MQPEEQKLIMRLRSAEGHLRAIIGMIEAGQPCEDVLHQLTAVEAAVRAAGLVALRQQLRSCAQVIVSNPCPEERCAELERLLNLYQSYSKKPSFYQLDLSEVENE
jgi:DNA-binding FrmR family transcriptional regulator